ncbi:hypothetical protein BSKO_07643 [Bryopsis sp. KO-2023]|nr:hypothetical protein BSKO_07643 [Bryopsis sp. KO-2023]
MYHLTQTKELGVGVWDGQYEHFLDDESRTIKKSSVEVPPCPGSDTTIPFEDRVFMRYVRLLAFVDETAMKDEWLLVLLETAREIDMLAGALLHGVDRAGHEVDIESFPPDESQWLRGPAELSKNDFGKEMHFIGECLIFRGLDMEHELIIFGGVTLDSKLRSQKFTEAWYGSHTSGEFRNFMSGRSCLPPDVAEDEATELTWDEAIQHYSTWVRRSFSGMPVHSVKHLKSALLDHRCERFGMALRMARLSDRAEKVLKSESGGAGLVMEVNDAQAGLEEAKHENEVLKEKLRQMEEDLEGLAGAKAAALEDDLAKVKRELNSAVEENQTLSSKMEEALAKHNTESDRFQQELKNAETQVQSAQRNLENSKTQGASMKEEKRTLSMSLEKANDSQAQAAQSIKILELELENTRMEAAEQEKRAIELEQEVNGYKCRLLDAEKQLAEAQTENEKIRVEIKSQGDGTCELCIFHEDDEDLDRELAEMKAKLSMVEKEKADLQTQIDAQKASDCDALRIAAREAQKGNEKLEIAQTKLTSVENQVKNLQSEVAGYRRHMASLTSGSSGINVAGSPLPSSLDVIGNYNKTTQKVLDIYFECGPEDVQAQESFGSTILELLKEMYILMRDSYIRSLTSMLAALGNIEDLESMTRSTHEAYDVYCKRYWKEMFLKLKDGLVAEVDVSSANEVQENHNDNGLNGSKPLQVNGFAHAEGNSLSEINQSHCVELDEGVDGDAPEASPENCEGSSQTLGGSPSKSMQSVFDSFRAAFPQETGNLDPSIFKQVFDELWETTVVMFLQRPQMRFSFSEQILGKFDGERHAIVDTQIAAGQDKISLIPRVLRAPQDFSVLTTEEGLGSDVGWCQEEKSQVDAPVFL